MRVRVCVYMCARVRVHVHNARTMYLYKYV